MQRHSRIRLSNPSNTWPRCPSPLPCKRRLQVTFLTHCNDVAVEYELKGCVPLWDDPDQDQWSKITRIMVDQMNRWILVQSGFTASFALPWSEWSRITDPESVSDHLKGTHPGRSGRTNWKTNIRAIVNYNEFTTIFWFYTVIAKTNRNW